MFYLAIRPRLGYSGLSKSRGQGRKFGKQTGTLGIGCRLPDGNFARVAELVDARDLKSLGAKLCTSSILVPGTNKIKGLRSKTLPLYFFNIPERPFCTTPVQLFQFSRKIKNRLAPQAVFIKKN